jgi:hypothetical protein
LHGYVFHRLVSSRAKVKLSLCLTKHHAMKAYWGSGGITPRILDHGTRWRWVVSLRPGRFTPRERAPVTHWIGGWVGSRAVLNAVVRRKIPSPRRESNPRIPIVQPVAQCCTDWAITASSHIQVKCRLLYTHCWDCKTWHFTFHLLELFDGKGMDIFWVAIRSGIEADHSPQIIVPKCVCVCVCVCVCIYTGKSKVVPVL